MSRTWWRLPGSLFFFFLCTRASLKNWEEPVYKAGVRVLHTNAFIVQATVQSNICWYARQMSMWWQLKKIEAYNESCTVCVFISVKYTVLILRTTVINRSKDTRYSGCICHLFFSHSPAPLSILYALLKVCLPRGLGRGGVNQFMCSVISY